MEKFDGLSFYGHEDKELQKEYERMFCNMTQENKQLLLKDLCARLPYGVKIYSDIGGDNTLLCIYGDRVFTTCEEPDKHNDYPLDCIKPYLRPMSSMTDEELMELGQLKYQDDKNWEIVEMRVVKHDFVIIKCRNKHNEDYWVFQISKTEPLRSWQGIDWLLEHHFDYRELIPMGLALEAPEGMYKTE